MKKMTTDKLSLLYKTDLKTIQKRLEDYYKINIEEIYQKTQMCPSEEDCLLFKSSLLETLTLIYIHLVN